MESKLKCVFDVDPEMLQVCCAVVLLILLLLLQVSYANIYVLYSKSEPVQTVIKQIDNNTIKLCEQESFKFCSLNY